MNIIKTLLIISILSISIYSQNDIDTTNWYPLEIGNRWEFDYDVSVSESFSINIEVIADTLINEKTFYKIKIDDDFVFQRVENNEKVWEYNSFTDQEYIRYDFSLPDRSIWDLDSISGQYGVYESFEKYVQIYGDTLESKIYTGAYIDTNSADPDTSWMPVVDGLAIVVTKGLGITEYGQGITIGSFTGAIINGDTLGTITRVEDLRVIQNDYKIYQNYPNPFNPSTTIEFTIPKKEEVQLNIFNSLGQKIAVLIDEPLSNGNYRIDFNGQKYSSGVYFYQLKTKNYCEVKKMLLLK